MSPLVLPIIQLAQKLIPVAFNDKKETKFDLSAALNIALIAALFYFFGPENTESVIELSETCQ